VPDDRFDDTQTVQRRLSVPAGDDRGSVSRRRFLQIAAGGFGAAAVLPSWLAADAAAMPDAAMAAPIGPNDGVLVLIQMAGGNDGLNMVVPTSNGHYYDFRPTTGIRPDDALDIGSGFGLHPALGRLKSRWDAGHVAAVLGVGEEVPDLSHFTSTAVWMSGWSGTPVATGWLGRYLDGLGADPLHGVCLGTTTPLHCVGATTKATALPIYFNDAFGADTSDPEDVRMYDCVHALTGGGSTGLGQWGDALAVSGSQTIDLAQTVAPLYESPLPPGSLIQQMVLAARLINANLGLRVICVGYGDFDTHAGQPPTHDSRMAELDAAIHNFYTELSPTFSGRSTIATWSEFGRRLEENTSRGTDHGEASALFVVGDHVAGGFYGEMPSLAPADLHWGDPTMTVSNMAVYATLLDSWLGADADAILGASHENLSFFASGPS
jgi:uncharacterized protein (DUF1501 family)